MFQPVTSRPDFPARELDILAFWRESGAFERLLQQNAGGPRFSFLDGPITANNPMGVHHAWGRTYKDLFQRYQAMLGKRERYQNGFDCQGLWVEVEVEKELGLNSKREIEAFGLARFAEACRARVLRYAATQTEQSIRLGQWMRWDDSYFTMSDSNIEDIWGFLKVCQEKGWLYRGFRSMPWCVRCGTSLSQHELIDSYREVTHLAVTVQLPLKNRPNEAILVWTTTPWTLPANVAAAVHPDLDYVAVRQGDRVLYLGQNTQNVLRGPYTVLRTLKGQELVGWEYVGPYDDLPAQRGPEGAPVHRIVPWTAVAEDEGTGIVHIAPGCGQEDYELARAENLPAIVPIDDAGNYFAGFGWLADRNATQVAPEIADDLGRRDLLYADAQYTHRYPVCWRCGSELVFKLVDEWFIAADEIRPAMIQAARDVEWVPDWAGKRMEDWLQNMGDWCISRKRFWGLPLPFYICDQGDLTVVGSKAELERLTTPESAAALAGLRELHRPWIDEIAIRCPKCGGVARRVSEVGDCWLDAGIVPFSTLEYQTNRDYWAEWFPADLVLEMREQIRLWFYAMLFMSVTLVGKSPYRRAFVYEKVFDEFGRPMHKSAGNAISFSDAVEKMGADVMRWLYCSANPEVNLNFGFRLADETRRKLLTLWNVYAFFVTYANLDHFDPHAPSVPVARRGVLDRWILARLQEVTATTRRAFEGYAPAEATRALEAFFDDLSNWYLRRSRRRFWKSEADDDKQAAYQTLYEVLIQLARLLAPITPFLAEDLYQNLVRSVDPEARISIHLTAYPEVKPELRDGTLIREVALAREIVELGRAARNQARIKVRQPLTEALVQAPGDDHAAIENMADQIREELNVKAIRLVDDLTPKPAEAVSPPQSAEAGNHPASPVPARSFATRPREATAPSSQPAPATSAPKHPNVSVAVNGDLAVGITTTITPDLAEEGLAREIVHRIQALRKTAGFNLDDRIVTYYAAPEEIARVFARYGPYIKAETLSNDLVAGPTPGGATVENVVLNGIPVLLAVAR